MRQDKEERWPKTEADLARPVVAYLADFGWDVYQEVQLYQSGSVADIVAVQRGIVWVVECKKTVCFDLLAQAENWRPYSHYTSVCVPGVSERALALTLKFLKLTGIGMLRADRYGSVWERERSRLNRHADTAKLLGVLCEQHKTYAPAGTDSGKRWTAFQQTCDAIRRKVESSPGIDMKALLAEIETHYATPASARSNIKHWADAGKIRGVRLVRRGRSLLFYPEGYDPDAAAPEAPEGQPLAYTEQPGTPVQDRLFDESAA